MFSLVWLSLFVFPAVVFGSIVFRRYFRFRNPAHSCIQYDQLDLKKDKELSDNLEENLNQNRFFLASVWGVETPDTIIVTYTNPCDGSVSSLCHHTYLDVRSSPEDVENQIEFLAKSLLESESLPSTAALLRVSAHLYLPTSDRHLQIEGQFGNPKASYLWRVYSDRNLQPKGLNRKKLNLADFFEHEHLVYREAVSDYLLRGDRERAEDSFTTLCRANQLTGYCHLWLSKMATEDHQLAKAEAHLSHAHEFLPRQLQVILEGCSRKLISPYDEIAEHFISRLVDGQAFNHHTALLLSDTLLFFGRIQVCRSFCQKLIEHKMATQSVEKMLDAIIQRERGAQT